VKTVRFPTPDALFDHAAARVASDAAEAIRARGRFFVALAGGATPIPLYERLAHAEAIDWTAVDIFFSDERCVPADDPASSFGAAKASLLDRVSVPYGQVHRIEGERDPIGAADDYEVRVRETLGDGGRFDLVLLGLGVDGHTASLFPRHQALTETDRWVLPVHVSADPAWRVTMTLVPINAARNVLFLAVSTAKAHAVRALAERAPIPASHVRPTDGECALLVDAEAATLLET